MLGFHQMSPCAFPRHAAQIKTLQIEVCQIQRELHNLREWTHSLHQAQSMPRKKRQHKKKSQRQVATQTDFVTPEMMLDQIDSDTDFECV
jgi:hypothetical protein